MWKMLLCQENLAADHMLSNRSFFLLVFNSEKLVVDSSWLFVCCSPVLSPFNYHSSIIIITCSAACSIRLKAPEGGSSRSSWAPDTRIVSFDSEGSIFKVLQYNHCLLYFSLFLGYGKFIPSRVLRVQGYWIEHICKKISLFVLYFPHFEIQPILCWF